MHTGGVGRGFKKEKALKDYFFYTEDLSLIIRRKNLNTGKVQNKHILIQIPLYTTPRLFYGSKIDYKNNILMVLKE